jgi:hypothetical protein
MTEQQPAFRDALLEGMKLVQQATGHFPNFFADMVQEHGAVDAVTQLITAEKPTTTFAKLYDLGKLALAVEDYALRPQWKDLFTRDTLKSAYDRLAEYGYDFPPDRWTPRNV